MAKNNPGIMTATRVLVVQIPPQTDVLCSKCNAQEATELLIFEELGVRLLGCRSCTSDLIPEYRDVPNPAPLVKLNTNTRGQG